MWFKDMKFIGINNLDELIQKHAGIDIIIRKEVPPNDWQLNGFRKQVFKTKHERSHEENKKLLEQGFRTGNPVSGTESIQMAYGNFSEIMSVAGLMKYYQSAAPYPGREFEVFPEQLSEFIIEVDDAKKATEELLSRRPTKEAEETLREAKELDISRLKENDLEDVGDVLSEMTPRPTKVSGDTYKISTGCGSLFNQLSI